MNVKTHAEIRNPEKMNREQFRMVHFPFDSAAEELITQVISKDEVFAFPTETLYGLGGNALSHKVVQEVYRIKRRPVEKSLLILVDESWLHRLTSPQAPAISEIVKRFWPGPLTLILPASREAPDFLRGPGKTIAVRHSNSAVVQRLIELGTSPLIGTSANLSGYPPCVSPEEVREQLQEQIGLLVDGGTLPKRQPTTILNCAVSPFVLVRAGALPAEHLRPFL